VRSVVNVPPRDVIVIGASAGGVKALSELVSGLPAGFPASLFIVLHVSPSHKSYLPDILGKRGPLPAVHPSSRDPIEPGKIYIAPPDLHLLLQDGHVELWRGPKENGHRPAINALFRSAAVSYGPRVAAIVLSGGLDDGSAGLWWVKRYGGVAIVQDPHTAEQPEMPHNALQYADVDYVLELPDIAPLLVKLAAQKSQPPAAATADDMPLKPSQDASIQKGHPLEATCPDCGGPLSEVQDGRLHQFRCLVGHTYSPRSLLEAHSSAEERALWNAVVKLEEAAEMVRHLSADVPPELAARLQRQTEVKKEQAATVRRVLEKLEPYQLE